MIPQLIDASAKLNIGLKKTQCIPPNTGIPSGQVHEKRGK